MPAPVEVTEARGAGASANVATTTGPLEGAVTDHLHVRHMGVGVVARGRMMVAR